MENFKFFQKYAPIRRGKLQWLLEPAQMVIYTDRTYHDDGTYTEKIKTRMVCISYRRIRSYNDFMEMYRNSIIFVYEFVNYSDMIYYKQDNLDDMPRDMELLFKGAIYENI
jgi:hypothetical protein